MQKKSRNSVRFLAVLGISALILLTFSFRYHSPLLTASIALEQTKVYSQSLIPHEPISISNDADFEKLGFEGNGTETSPYLIRDLSIKAKDYEKCISIISTSAYFVIQNCKLFSLDFKSSGTGVYLEKVSNGAVIDCDISSLAIGISVVKSGECILKTNTLSDLQKGIYMSQSIWMKIEGNEIAKSAYGIHLHKMDYSDLETNIISDSDYGILIESSYQIHLLSNKITDSFLGLYLHDTSVSESFNSSIHSSRFGVYYAYSQECNVTSSRLTGNSYGITFLEVDQGVISSNLVKFNAEFGIYLKDSRDVETLSNIVFQNFGVGIHLVGVGKSSIQKNEIGYNKESNAADFVGDSIPGIVNNWDTNAWSDYFGASTYGISGDRGSVDNNPHYILYLHPPSDLIAEAPASGFVNWTVSGFNPSHFKIEVNDVPIEESAWDGSNISSTFTDLDPGDYSFVLSVTTASGISASDEVKVHVQDTTPPEWIQVTEDLIIECGSSVSSQLIASDYYGIERWWINNTDFSIDGGLLQNITPLYFGAYNLEVRAYDPSDNFVSQKLRIVVTDTILPSVDSPSDVSFFEGETGFEVEWNVYDDNPVSYEILMDGVSVEFGDWTSDNLLIRYSLDGLTCGIYTFSIILTDIAGNVISDDVLVTVEELVKSETTSETSSTSTTTISTESPTSSDEKMTGPPILTLGLFGAGAVGIIIILFMTKRK